MKHRHRVRVGLSIGPCGDSNKRWGVALVVVLLLLVYEKRDREGDRDPH